MTLSYVMSFQNAKALKAKKEEGNKAFKEGNFEAAYELYSEALTIDPNNIKTNAKLYCNRATVGSKVRNMHITQEMPLVASTFDKLFGSSSVKLILASLVAISGCPRCLKKS